jgi:magnesium-transporting ATPase (P-type)
VICDNPNEILDQWEGILKIGEDSNKIICSIKNLLVRGSVLRNTEWGIGIAIYTGQDTKIFRNSKNPPHKVSNVMRKMNSMLCQVFILQVAIIFLCAGLNYYWAYNNYSKHPEIGKSSIDLAS